MLSTRSQPSSQHPVAPLPFYVRNLTSSVLELRLIEQYAALSTSAMTVARWGNSSGLSRHVTGWVARATGYGDYTTTTEAAPEAASEPTPEPTPAQAPAPSATEVAATTTTTAASVTIATVGTAEPTAVISSKSIAAVTSVAQPASIGLLSPSASPISPSQALLAATAQSYARQRVSVRLEPFTLRSVNGGEDGEEINVATAFNQRPEENLRLTVAVLNDTDNVCEECHRIDFPLANGIDGNNSDTSDGNENIITRNFKPLQHDAQRKFTGIFILEQKCLVIFSTANFQCWMRKLNDTTPLSALSIAGTHNTPTYHRALPSVRCQAVPPREQLQNGIRFFDVRVQPESATDSSNRSLYLVHSVFPISLTGTKYFGGLIDEIAAFLQENPSEAVIMSIKREGAGDATDEHLSKILREHYTARDDGKLWYTSPAIPTLGQVRGKIVLLRRFRIDSSIREHENEGNGWGLEAECWANNTAHDLHGVVCVQDFYEVLASKNISEKISYVTDHLSCSAAAVTPLPRNDTEIALNSEASEHLSLPPPPFYLNFLSASNFWRASCWPDKIAEKLNPAIVKYLCTSHCQADQPGDGSTGIVVCDFVGKDGNWDIVKCIVGMNSRLELREKRIARSLRTR